MFYFRGVGLNSELPRIKLFSTFLPMVLFDTISNIGHEVVVVLSCLRFELDSLINVLKSSQVVGCEHVVVEFKLCKLNDCVFEVHFVLEELLLVDLIRLACLVVDQASHEWG